MTAMRMTVTQPDVRPRGWTGLALLVVALLAVALTIGLTVHHDEVDLTPPTVAAQSADIATDVEVGIADIAGSSIQSTSSTNLLVICTLLLLCCVILLAASLRARGPSRGGVAQNVLALRSALGTVGASLTQSVSLDALSISRT